VQPVVTSTLVITRTIYLTPKCLNCSRCVQFSQQTAIISLYSTDRWLVFVMQTRCVYCEVEARKSFWSPQVKRDVSMASKLRGGKTSLMPRCGLANIISFRLRLTLPSIKQLSSTAVAAYKNRRSCRDARAILVTELQPSCGYWHSWGQGQAAIWYPAASVCLCGMLN
jgi:hypothetical protein